MAAETTTATENTTRPHSPESLNDNILRLPAKETSSKSGSESNPTKTGQSTKSASVSKPPRSQPKLRRILRRGVSARVPLDEDLGYVYAAYVKGAMPERFGIPSGLKPREFDAALSLLLEQVEHFWIMAGARPFGFALGVNFGAFILPGDFTWFPWASDRNRLEGIVALMMEINKSGVGLFWTNHEEKHLWTHVAKYGVIRRVGTIEMDDKIAMWQTRKLKDA